MPEQKCPKCGAEYWRQLLGALFRERDMSKGARIDAVQHVCRTEQLYGIDGKITNETRESATCLRNQLAAVTAERDALIEKNLHLIAENAALKADKLCKDVEVTKPGHFTGKIIAEKVWRG